MNDHPDAGCIVDEDHPFILTKDTVRWLTHCQFRGGGQIVLYYGDDPVDENTPDTATAPDTSSATAAPAPAPAVGPAPAPATKAITEVPSAPTASNEINSIIAQAGGANGSTVLLALIAVAGGGAGWKFYQSFAKQKHEEKMKQLEIEERKTDNHQACAAQRAELVAQHAELVTHIKELTQKVAALEQRHEEVTFAGSAAEELEKRVKKLENAAKRGKPKATTLPT